MEVLAHCWQDKTALGSQRKERNIKYLEHQTSPIRAQSEGSTMLQRRAANIFSYNLPNGHCRASKETINHSSQRR